MVATTQMPLTVSGFTSTNATIVASFPVDEVLGEFQKTLQAEWSKRTRKATFAGQVAVQGNIVRIDEGNRWLRYFLVFFAGHTVFEVEGTWLYNGQPLGTFCFNKRQAGGLFGGDSKALLKLCAKAAAGDIVKQLIGKLPKNG